MSGVHFKLEPELLRAITAGQRPVAHSLKCSVVDIQGEHVNLAFAFCDENDEALCVLHTGYLMVHSIMTLANLEQAFNLTVSGS